MSVGELQAAASAMPANEGYQAQILLEECSCRFAADGTLVYHHRMMYRVDSQAALENWSEISARGNPGLKTRLNACACAQDRWPLRRTRPEYRHRRSHQRQKPIPTRPSTCAALLCPA